MLADRLVFLRNAPTPRRVSSSSSSPNNFWDDFSTDTLKEGLSENERLGLYVLMISTALLINGFYDKMPE